MDMKHRRRWILEHGTTARHINEAAVLPAVFGSKNTPMKCVRGRVVHGGRAD